MAKAKAETVISAPVGELAAAIAAATKAAIEESRPRKKTVVTRRKNSPWDNKDGSPKPRLKRKFYQHGVNVTERFLTSENINLINKLRPGTFCDGHVRVTRRRDKGVDIDYPIKTATQRLRLVNQFGIRNFKELLERCIDEAANPKPQIEDLD